MRTIHSKKKLFLYGMSAMGVNMLNLIVGSYLCDALMTEGFAQEIEYWTYANTTLVVSGIWSVLIMLSKILDGLIDIPLSSFAGEGTSQVGRQFLKSYAGVCLQGAVIIIACIIFSVVAETPTVATGGDATSMVWSWLLQTIFYFLVLVGAVKMSDRVVKEMIGF